MTHERELSTAGDLADALLDVAEEQLTALAAGPLPGFHLPRMLIGQEAGPDVRADLVFTLGLMHECGRTEIAGVAVTDAITNLLADVHGKRTNTFYSYRIAETVARFGSFADNSLLAALTDAQRAQVATAVDSTDWIELLDAGVLPRNYASVLALCEQARRTLGLIEDDDERLALLLVRTQDLLGAHLDDSNTGIGRYDVYTVDLNLFCEPLADLVGEPWRRGAKLALDLVDRVATRDGAAIAWGRSTGILATCHMIELAGLAARHDLTDDQHRWYARAADATPRLDGWFRDGWITAHQHRSSDPYRGLDRRLQMTLDCLGKLPDTARGLQRVAAAPIDRAAVELFPDRDEMIWFDRARNAGVWSFRNDATAFVLPLVGATTTDYLPAPRNPGLFEVPVGSDLATASPVLLHRGKRYTSGGRPSLAEHTTGSLHASYDGFPLAGEMEPNPDTPTFDGGREVTWRVEGRTLQVEERLTFDEAPHALALQVTEPGNRPLQVRFACDVPHTTTTVEVDGIQEYRSCWSELRRLHQIDIEPATAVNLRWSVTPMLRTLSTGFGHWYSDSLYAPLADRVRVGRLTHTVATNPSVLQAPDQEIDQLHMHWPEWHIVPGIDAHHWFIDGLRDAGVRIVWTQHNLVPHSKDPAMLPVYALWAKTADLVIHHSSWGRDKALATYDYGAHTRHVVIPHGNFGPANGITRDAAVRAEVEAQLGLRAGVTRLGVFGAPRTEKDVELVMRAMARCGRDDLELLVLSLSDDDVVPDDPRIKAWPYEMVAREEYDRRLLAVDALVMPFDPDGEMLTTGTIGDALGFGLPTIGSSWPFLTEALGDATITYGRTEDDLVACLDALTPEQLEATGAAARALRPEREWDPIAEQTYAALDALGSTHH
jgi:glycosyltransferase involved in cell wall biosynthesis